MLGIVTWCGHACSEIALYPFLCIVSYLLETHGWCYSLCVRICMDYRELFHSIWGYQVSKTDYIVTKKKFIIVHRTSCSADPSCFADLCLALCAVTLKRGSAAPGREPFYIFSSSGFGEVSPHACPYPEFLCHQSTPERELTKMRTKESQMVTMTQRPTQNWESVHTSTATVLVHCRANQWCQAFLSSPQDCHSRLFPSLTSNTIHT